jgi:hypothetical protein
LSRETQNKFKKKNNSHCDWSSRTLDSLLQLAFYTNFNQCRTKVSSF